MQAVSSFAHSAYDRVAEWLSDDEPAPAAAAPVAPIAPVSPPVDGADNAPSTPSRIGAVDGEATYHTKAATMEGTPLEISKTRADLGDKGTKYSRSAEDGAAAYKAMMEADPNATVFYCSMLSIWALSVAGYDIAKPIVGADGQPYTYTVLVPVKKKGKQEVDDDGNPKTKPVEKTINMKEIIDGDPKAIETMTLAKKKGMVKGGSVGQLGGLGYQIAYEADGDEADAFAAKGAASAFEITGIGSEIDQLVQKPGDFAQSRRMTDGKIGDDPSKWPSDAGVVRHRGAGHAWQVWSVRARGGAMFGRPGSPKAAGKDELTGWHDDVEYVIDPDTDPALVGEHTIIKATRMEANFGGHGTLKKGGDGGVTISKEYAVPEKLAESTHVYYGRLGASRWNGWTAAKKPA
jgi:hypothetical protein